MNDPQVGWSCGGSESQHDNTKPVGNEGLVSEWPGFDNLHFYIDICARLSVISDELPTLQVCFTMNGAIEIIARIGLILALFSVLPSNPFS